MEEQLNDAAKKLEATEYFVHRESLNNTNRVVDFLDQFIRRFPQYAEKMAIIKVERPTCWKVGCLTCTSMKIRL